VTITEFRTQHPELFKNAVDSIDWGEVTENLDAYRSFDYLRSDLISSLTFISI